MIPKPSRKHGGPVRHRQRQAVRWLALATAVCLAWPGWSPDLSEWLVVVLPALSPYVAAGGAVGTRSLGMLALVSLPLLLLAWQVRRGFCRFGCPVGLLQDTLTRLRPRGPRHRLRLPVLGPWLVIAGLAGAVLGYPWFLWLDPLAIFSAGLNAWRTPLTGAALMAGFGLPALLLVELLWPRLWCARVCPLAAGQQMLWQGRRRLAPRTPGTTPGGSVRQPAEGLAGFARQSRRGLLAASAGVVGALIGRGAHGAALPRRPPGALDEGQFGGVCVRCGNCARVCPSHIIRPDLAAGGGWAAWLAPRLEFERDYCREDCHRCNLACPSGAIARLSLAEKRRRGIGLAHVNTDTCLMALGRECSACVRACPYQAISIDSSGDPFSPRPHVSQPRCNGCGACEAACPTRPFRAIRVAAPRGHPRRQPRP